MNERAGRTRMPDRGGAERQNGEGRVRRTGELFRPGGESDRRHDHANGTLMTRPSTRCTIIAPSVTCTWEILGSLLTVVLLPLR